MQKRILMLIAILGLTFATPAASQRIRSNIPQATARRDSVVIKKGVKFIEAVGKNSRKTFRGTIRSVAKPIADGIEKTAKKSSFQGRRGNPRQGKQTAQKKEKKEEEKSSGKGGNRRRR